MGRFDLLFDAATMRVGAGNPGGNREIRDIELAHLSHSGPAPDPVPRYSLFLKAFAALGRRSGLARTAHLRRV